MFPLTWFFINNFPAAMSVFVIDAFVVAALAWLTTKAAVALKNRAGLSDGVVGGLLLGIITSVPELISSIAGAINYGLHPDSPGSSILGDAIGSNMFCLFILAVALLGGIVIFVRKEANQINTITLVCVAVGVVFCLMAGLFDNCGMIYKSGNASPFVWHGFNFFSIFILLSYVAAVFFMIYGEKIESKGNVVNAWANQNSILPVSQKARKVMFSHLKLWVIIVLFAIFSILLTGSSIVLESSAEGVIEHFEMEAVFGRTLLLGIASSLPELTALVSLVFEREYNMSINSIVGSCGFNMTILFVSNLAYSCVFNTSILDQAMFALDKKSLLLLVIFLLQIIFMILYLIMNSKSMKQLMVKKQTISFNGVLLGSTCLFYVVYLILGFVLSKNL